MHLVRLIRLLSSLTNGEHAQTTSNLIAEALTNYPRETATHLALTVVRDLLTNHSGPNANAQPVTVEAVTARVRAMLPDSFEGDAEFPGEEVEHAIGEVSVPFFL